MKQAQARTSETLLGAWLLALAGFIDAIAFTVLQGSFVAFMSGNTTIFAVSMARGNWGLLWGAALLIALFFLGCVAGAALTRWAGRHARTAVLWTVCVLLVLCAMLAHPLALPIGVVLLALVGGLMNSALAPHSNVTVGVTYITGTLVKAAHQLVAGFATPQRWAWLVPFGFWLMFMLGALCGAIAFYSWNAGALWVAAAAALVACLLPRMKQGGPQSS